MKYVKFERAPRVQYLESLRGLAALAVVLFHFLAAFYPGALLGRTIDPVDSAALREVFYGAPFGFLVSGHFAVAVFFVLSGYVLTNVYFQTRDKSVLQKQAIKRIVRLGVPVFVVVVVAATLIGMGAMASQALASFNNSPEAARVFNFSPDWPWLLWDATVGVFIAGNEAYNPVLWTMRIELFGSFLVFAVAAVMSRYRWRWLVYAALVAILWQSYYPCFIVGLALADLLSDAKLRHRLIGAVNGKIAALIVVAIVVLGSFPLAGRALDGGLYGALQIIGVSQIDSFRIWQSVGASLLVGLLLVYGPLQRALSGNLLVWLGSVSFGLYLTHYLVIHSLGARVFLALEPALGYHLAFTTMFTVTLPVIIGVAWAWTKLVDQPTIRLGNKTQRLLKRG
jgi:peptidoglycan/LPS O-acetylase OafA/YrhL